MYDAWQSSLDTDHRQRERRQKRRREKQEEQDKKLVELQFAARREAHNNIYSEDTVGEDSGDPSSTQLDETSGADELGFVSRNPSKDGKGKVSSSESRSDEPVLSHLIPCRSSFAHHRHFFRSS